jgi:hypothetical protein
VKKTKEVYGLSTQQNAILQLQALILWMSKGAHDMFALVIIFGGDN